jgi:hypothetical protein
MNPFPAGAGWGVGTLPEVALVMLQPEAETK